MYLFFKACRSNNKQCPVQDVLAPTVDKWSILVLYNLAYNDVMRYNALQKRVKGISSRMLSVTLKKLEKLNMVQRKVYPEVPPRVEYKLTDFGMHYAKRLTDLNFWLAEQVVG